VIATDVRAFARANLPPPPARIVEVGAGAGELARALAAAGYDVLAIDPEPRGTGVTAAALADLDEPDGSFVGAIATVSLHHVEPLGESCAVLARVLETGAPLLVDEFDVAALDTRAAEWWLEQRRVLGEDHPVTPEQLVDEHRSHLHSLADIAAALAPHFELGQPVRGAYLYRWNLNESLRPVEEDLIARGELPAVGARLVASRH
jgi:SAM-dependent methyltransferase